MQTYMELYQKNKPWLSEEDGAIYKSKIGIQGSDDADKNIATIVSHFALI